ncbi:solute carrier family 26 member 9-like isoform X1 [Acanthopagrus latus]|uniref:solute carrier family 26 member 9-like isoform X1 n=2 Tax=Acanthopagrus latus TaxID=8177 RepID=UPI00187CD92A|nr:solute carrier family 26 member 9-like isoform X1 [Acanthopagrus latus]XP_036961166.1 solute carrier family 26 member 9-like isoform X1 [Acanthopagrus latus]XP_036961168.1 solute carrier family 26 member 9-like isoform X1 [Acanthopagrus latus]
MQPDRPRYVIDRPAYNLPDFDKEFDKKSRQFPVGEKVKKLFRCSATRLRALLFRHLPALGWLPKYKAKENLLCDVISGVSAGTIQVPQGMAFALLASLPPVNGLYSSFFPLIPYFFMGTAHQMVPGTFAVLSIMVGIVCLRLAPESDFSHFNQTLNATVVDTDQMNNVRLGISGTLACLTAIIQIGLGFMQFGFVAIYLSESFVRGFMTAAGLQILISVLKYIFGISVPPYSGPLAVIYTLVDIIRGLPDTNVASLVFALVSSLVLIVVKELGARYRHKLPFPVPMEIIIVVVATAISGPLHLPEIYHMDIVGEIPLGFPTPILPTVSQWEDMLSTAFSLAIVGYVINLAMGRTLAAKHGYDVDPNQEMLALGCSNFLGSFFKIHVICCALSVTLAVDSAGGTSQFASLCVMLVVMVTMLALGAYLKPLPKSVLGALIAVNLKNTLLQLSDPYYLWKKSKLDCCVWVVSFLATFFLSLPYGVAIGVGSSILVVIFKTQFRNGSSVVQIMDTDIYKNPKVYSKVTSITGVKIVNYCSPLYFANAEIFRQRVIRKTGLDPGKLILARRKFLEKEQKEKAKEERKDKETRRRKPSSLVTMKSQTISQLELQNDFDMNDGSASKPEPPTSYVNFHCSDIEPGEQAPDREPPSPTAVTLESQPVPFHTLILDLAGVCFVDLMGIKVLTKMNSSYATLGIKLYLANVQAQVYEELEAGGAFDEGNIDRCNLFLSVHDAILFAQQTTAERRVSLKAEKARQELAFNINEDLEQEMF